MTHLLPGEAGLRDKGRGLSKVWECIQTRRRQNTSRTAVFLRGVSVDRVPRGGSQFIGMSALSHFISHGVIARFQYKPARRRLAVCTRRRPVQQVDSNSAIPYTPSTCLPTENFTF